MSDPVVQINVGGTVFSARLSTLSTNSEFFKALYKRESKYLVDTLYIDKDPDVFALLLKSWRGYTVYVDDLADINQDCEFYDCKKFEAPESEYDRVARFMKDATVDTDRRVHKIIALKGLLHASVGNTGTSILVPEVPTNDIARNDVEFTGCLLIPAGTLVLPKETTPTIREYTICYERNKFPANIDYTVKWVV